MIPAQLVAYVELSHHLHAFLVLEQGLPEDHEIVEAVKLSGAFAASVLQHNLPDLPNNNPQQPEE